MYPTKPSKPEPSRKPSKLEFSRIAYGAWRLSDERDLSRGSLLRRIELCLELGVTTFDHADIYGNYRCEGIFGEALGDMPAVRDRMQLVTKCGIMLPSASRPETGIKHYDTSSEHIVESVETSLRNLKTDRLDLLLIHRPDPFMDPEAAAQGLESVVASGKVLHVGVSNFAPWQFDLLQGLLDIPLATNQIELSVMTQQPFLDGTVGQCQQRGISPMAWSPLGGGALFSAEDARAVRVRGAIDQIARDLAPAATPGQVAMAWLLAHPARIIPVIGTTKNERIEELARSVQLTLDRQQWFRIWTAAAGEVP